MNSPRTSFIVTSLISVALVGTAYADTRKMCERALIGMDFTIDTYVHEAPGIFSRERHNFGPITCTVNRDGSIRSIERGNEVIAEDGIFGPNAILFRDEAERLYSVIIAEARSERDAGIEAARQVFQREQQARWDQYSELEQEAQGQLGSLISQLREGSVDTQAAIYLGIDDTLSERLINDTFFQGFREEFETEQTLKNTERQESVSQITDLSREASQLRSGLSMCEVVDLLGAPSWIIWNEEDPEHEPFDVLYWENASCLPVAADFDDGVLVGWNEGRVMCGLDAATLDVVHPAEQFRTSSERYVDCR